MGILAKPERHNRLGGGDGAGLLTGSPDVVNLVLVHGGGDGEKLYAGELHAYSDLAPFAMSVGNGRSPSSTVPVLARCKQE